MSVSFTLFLFWSANLTVYCCSENLIKGYRLEGFAAEEIPNIGVHSCRKECLLRKHCYSINYNTKHFLCEINEISADVIVDGTKNGDFFFSNVNNGTDEELLGHCSDSPCPSSYKCIHTQDNISCLAVDCTAGTYGKDGRCIPCPEAQYNSGSSLQWCSMCKPGTYQDQTGSTSCKPCPTGTYQHEKGKTSCDPCPVGEHSPNVGSVQCTHCPPGTYQDQTGSTTCRHCPSGTYQPNHGMKSSDSCKPCGPGTYQGYTGQSACNRCSAGFYQPSAGQSSCLFCSEGYFQHRTGQTTCDECLRLRECTNLNRTACYDIMKDDKSFEWNSYIYKDYQMRIDCKRICSTDVNCEGFSARRGSEPVKCYIHYSRHWSWDDNYDFFLYPWQCRS